jgi:hypothetical protein
MELNSTAKPVSECREETCPVDISRVDIFGDIFFANKKKELTAEELENAKERVKILLEKVQISSYLLEIKNLLLNDGIIRGSLLLYLSRNRVRFPFGKKKGHCMLWDVSGMSTGF